MKPLPNEKELVEKATAKDHSAFTLLVQHYSPVVKSKLVVALDGDEGEAEDLMQKVFLEVWEGLPSFRKESKFSTWLYGLVRNQVRKHVRDEHTPPLLDIDEVPEEELEHYATHEDPLFQLEEDQMSRLVEAYIGNEPHDTQLLYNLYYVKGLSMAEVADTLVLPVSTVRMRLHHLKERITSLVTGD